MRKFLSWVLIIGYFLPLRLNESFYSLPKEWQIGVIFFSVIFSFYMVLALKDVLEDL